MANIETVLSATETETAMDNTTLNPTVVNTSGRVKVSVELTFVDMDFDPSDLYDALDAEYVTVATDDASPSRNAYTFVISGGLT